MTFDRLASIDRLTSDGIDEGHARAHAVALDTALQDGVATRSDLEALGRAIKSDFDDHRRETKADLHDLQRGFETAFVEYRKETKADLDRVALAAKADVEALGRTIRKDMGDLDTTLTAKINDAEHRLSSMIQGQGTKIQDLETKIQGLDTRIQDQGTKIQAVELKLEAKIETAAASVTVDVLRWMILTQAALGGFIFTILKFLH